MHELSETAQLLLAILLCGGIFISSLYFILLDIRKK